MFYIPSTSVCCFAVFNADRMITISNFYSYFIFVSNPFNVFFIELSLKSDFIDSKTLQNGALKISIVEHKSLGNNLRNYSHKVSSLWHLKSRDRN